MKIRTRLEIWLTEISVFFSKLADKVGVDYY